MLELTFITIIIMIVINYELERIVAKTYYG